MFGKRLCAANCMLCRGAEGSGRGPGAAAYNPGPANFTETKFRQAPDIDRLITHTARNGKGRRQAFPNLSKDDIQSIIMCT